MLLKLKKVFIYFICTVLLVTSVSFSAYKPLEVRATGMEIPVAVSSSALTTATYVLIDLLAVSLLSVGAYELYENNDYFASIVDDFIGTIGQGTAERDPWRHWTENDSGTHILNPNNGQWERIPDSDSSIVIVDGKESDFLGVPEGTIMTKKEHDELFQQKLHELYNRMHSDEGGGGGQEPEEPNEPKKGKNPFPNIFNYLKDNEDIIKVSLGSGAVACVGKYVSDLLNGEHSTSNSELNEFIQNQSTDVSGWRGNYTYDADGKISVFGHYQYTYLAHNYNPYNYVIEEAYISAKVASNIRPYLYYLSTSSDGFKNYCVCDEVQTLTQSGWANYYYESNDTLRLSQRLSPVMITISNKTGFSINIPVFESKEAGQAYARTGDWSEAINHRTYNGVTPETKRNSKRLPAIINPYSSIPKGKAITMPALKNVIEELENTKPVENPTQAPTIDPDRQPQIAKEIIERNIETHITDYTPVDVPIPSPSPSNGGSVFVPPAPPDMGIEGLDATRDWRLVFPFCIPFDIIDLFNTLCAEPVAPRWEFPLQFPAYGIDYTFVIDFEQFDSVAEVFRLCETILYLLGLMILTGKVIKW